MDRKFDRRIKALGVYCEMKERGCDWKGALRDMDAHLDVVSGDCQYVDVECSYECDAQLIKMDLENHLLRVCPKRPYKCQYCHLERTHEYICGEHVQLCQQYPLPCPNRCAAGNIKRCEMKQHISERCPLESVFCDFRDFGCREKMMPRRDLPKHIEVSVMEHVSMMLNFLAENVPSERQGELLKSLRSALLKHNMISARELQELKRNVAVTSSRLHAMTEKFEQADRKLKEICKDFDANEAHIRLVLLFKQDKLTATISGLNNANRELREKEEIIEDIRGELVYTEDALQATQNELQSEKEERRKTEEALEKELAATISDLNVELREKEEELKATQSDLQSEKEEHKKAGQVLGRAEASITQKNTQINTLEAKLKQYETIIVSITAVTVILVVILVAVHRIV